jgi:shikimate kinase
MRKYYLRVVGNSSKNIIFIGFMGAGKTTLGKKVARRLSLPFVDVDAEIEKRIGLSIPQIFETYGEAHFRALERTFIHNIAPDFQAVLSTGGGLPCYQNNMEILLKLGQVFYLRRSAKELVNRLSKNKAQRPLLADLSDDEMLDFVNQKLEEREKFYKQAHWIPDRTQQEPDWILAQL